MPELLCFAWKTHGSCSQFDLLIMDSSQSPYNHSDSHCRSEWALSPKHAYVQPNKSCPALCSSWAIIVSWVQLHLKWQRPRAVCRIKNCVQCNTRFASCQRGCTDLPFLSSHPLSSSSPVHPCACYCLLCSPSSKLPLPKLSSTRGVRVEALWCVDEVGWRPVTLMPRFTCSTKDRKLYLHWCAAVVDVARIPARKKHICLHIL